MEDDYIILDIDLVNSKDGTDFAENYIKIYGPDRKLLLKAILEMLEKDRLPDAPTK